MFPKVYYLLESMSSPKRCYGGILLAFSLSGELQVKIEGKTISSHICLINESELYQIETKDILLYYFPASIFLERSLEIFNEKYSIDNYISLSNRLILLFKYFKSQKITLAKSSHLVDEILQCITRSNEEYNNHSQDVLFNITNYVFRHLKEKITLDKISRTFYMSSSNISTLFRNYMDISFYEYITSLRVAKSIGELITTSNNIEKIARNWGYASATNYIIHFKKYMGTTPKKYKTFPYTSNFLNAKETTSEIEYLRDIILNKKNRYTDIEVSISDKKIVQSNFKYFNLIDIGGYYNLDLILKEEVFKYKNFGQYKVDSYIYISESIEDLSTGEYKERILRLRNILKTKVSVAIKIQNLKSLNLIKKIIQELHFLESEHLPSSNVQNGNILLLLNLKSIKLEEVKTIQSSLYGTRIFTSIDITDMYIRGDTLIDSEIIKLNPDFYTLNFEKLNKKLKPSNKDTLKNFQKQLNDFLEEIRAYKNIIFLNYESLYPSEVLNNIGSFLETSLNVKKYLAGASIQFTLKSFDKNSISIFDETENKTPFFFLGIMLLHFSRYRCYYGNNYLITKNMHSYNILLYNSDNTKTNEINDYTKIFYIDFDQKKPFGDIIISSEMLNSTHGSVDGIINSTVLERNNFPNSLKYKLSQYNTPLLRVDTHNFKEGSYVIKLPPRSISMITIYMNE